jgi:hypothetical protein
LGRQPIPGRHRGQDHDSGAANFGSFRKGWERESHHDELHDGDATVSGQRPRLAPPTAVNGLGIDRLAQKVRGARDVAEGRAESMGAA